MPPPRPRGVGSGVASAPMSERQQMALLIQMTQPDQSRSLSKKNDQKKTDDDEISSSEKQEGLVARDKSVDEINLEIKKDVDVDDTSAQETSTASSCKRNFSDVDDDEFGQLEDCDDVKKKKRKDSESSKEQKTVTNLRLPAKIEKNIRQSFNTKSSPINSSSTKCHASSEKEPFDATKSNLVSTFENDGDDDEFKISENVYSGGLKVPPLKIVIPQQNCAIDADGTVSRSGKINASRSAALPYVVSSNNECNERDLVVQCNSPNESPLKPNSICAVIDEKQIKLLNEEKNLHRVLRSSHRAGISHERSSNNSSPQMQSSSPSPASSNANEAIEGKISFANITTSPLQQNQTYEHDNIVNLPSPSTSSTSSSKEVHTNTVEIHPRKRKIRPKHDENNFKGNTGPNASTEAPTNTSDTHPHDFPFTNCFQMYMNLRRQIAKKWKNLYPVKPRPPQGYNEYLIYKRNYTLSINVKDISIHVPDSISPKMKEIFSIQQKERNELFQRQTVEREKLCINVEQEIIRVHSKAARNISCQSTPYSVCTLLKDDEVYNLITPEQEEKDRSARYRFNGRLLLSWLQDVDDKWEKVKESMILRHHNEAESLHAVQLMDWEIALKRNGLCDYKSRLDVEKDHVPIVHVSDDFDLLPA